MDFASLGIRVDTAEVEKGKAELDGLTGAASRAEAATEALAPASRIAGQGVREVAEGATRTAPALDRQNISMRAATVTARQYSQAMRLLPAQITDIVTQLASGQSPFLIAIQQGGQIRDSFGGIGASLRALSSVITPARLALGATAGAAFLLAKAYNDAQKESFDLTKGLVLSGNAAGVSADKIKAMAEAIDDIVGTRGEAQEVLLQLAASGRIAGENLQRFATIAQLLNRTAGQPLEETVKIFEELSKAPVDAAVKLNEKTNFLTKSIYDQIVALEKRGDIDAAGALAQNAYADEALRRARELEAAMPGIQAATKDAGSAWREFWEAVSGRFSPRSDADRLKQLRELRGDRELFTGRAAFFTEQFTNDVEETRIAQRQADSAKRIADRAEQLRQVREAEITRRRAASAIQNERIVSDAAIGARQMAIDRELQNDLSQFSAYETQLEAQRDAHLISEEDYYAERRKLIEQNRDVQIAALEGERRLLEQRERAVRASTKREVDAARTPEDKARAEANAQAQLIELRQKILELESQIARLRGDAIAQSNTLSIQEQASGKAIAESYTTARESLEAYLRTLDRRRERELEGLGLGQRQREINESRSDIDDKLEEQRRDLARDLRRGQVTKEDYDRELALINEFHAKALNANDRFFDDLTEKQSNWLVGAQEAFANFADESANVAQQSERLFSNAFDNMTDAIIEFAQTGKLDFKALANSIIADLLRIQIQAAAVQIFGSFLGLSGVNSGSVGGLGAGSGTAPSSGGALYADVGIQRVPRDNQVAILHKDEAVLPAAMNPFAGGRPPWGGGPAVNLTTHMQVGAGVTVAQFAAALKARDEALQENVIAIVNDGMNRGSI